MYLNTHGHLQFKSGIYKSLQYLMIWLLAFGLTISFLNVTSLGLERVSSVSNNLFALLIQSDTSPVAISFPGQNFSQQGFRIPVIVTTPQPVSGAVLLGVTDVATGVDYVIGDMFIQENATLWRYNWAEESFAAGTYNFFVLLEDKRGAYIRFESDSFLIQ